MSKLWLSVTTICGTIVALLWGIVTIFRHGKKSGRNEVIAEQDDKTLEEISDVSKEERDWDNASTDVKREWLREHREAK